MAMSRLLRASGFAARTSSSARELLSERRADKPGCVVVDLRMPDLGGLDLQAALAHNRYPLPVLFLTGHADTASTVRAMRGAPKTSSEDGRQGGSPRGRASRART